MTEKWKRLKAALMAARDEMARYLVESIGVAREDAQKAVCLWEHQEVCRESVPAVRVCDSCGAPSPNGKLDHHRPRQIGPDTKRRTG